MKKRSFFSVVASSVMMLAPLAANAAPVTMRCGVGQVRIAEVATTGAQTVSFRNDVYSENETLCDQKLNAYCSVDRSDPAFIRLKWTVRGGKSADGDVRLAYDYLVDTKNNTVTTHISDRFGGLFSTDAVSSCTVGNEGLTHQVATRAVRWPLKVLFD